MELIIFIGGQATGKSTFFKNHFADTHIRLNLDMLKTRHREQILFQACLTAKQRCVIDNTNPTTEERQKYIELAKNARFFVIAYYFESDLAQALARNNQRQGKARIPEVGVRATFKKLQKPQFSEGFDRIFQVNFNAVGNADEQNQIVQIVKEWTNEV